MTGPARHTGSARTTGLDLWLCQTLRVHLSGASILLIFWGAAAVVLALPGSHRQTMTYAGLAGGVIPMALGEASPRAPQEHPWPPVHSLHPAPLASGPRKL